MDGRYVGAPYNFVTQWERVVERSREDCIAHNILNDELLTGEISYRFTAETDIAVGSNVEEFYKDPYGRYAIPGSSVRGMIRNNAQILSLSSIADDVDDYFLMYREVGGRSTNPNKKIYDKILGSKPITLDGKMISVLKNVKAGYLVKEGKDAYRIYRTVVDKINDTLGAINYYILNERAIAKDKLHENYPFFWSNPGCLQHDLGKDFKKEEKNMNKKYIPYYENVSYKIKGQRTVSYVGKAGSEKCFSGVALGTGKMNGKKCQYIIPEIDRSKPSIKLEKADIDAFRIDYVHKKNQLKGMFGEKGALFFDLPGDGEVKPVFYIEDVISKRKYFGYTPRLRLFYKHSVKEGLSESQKTIKIDHSKALFGFSNKDDNYKTRLSFSDAIMVSGKAGEKRQAILGEPSLSSYNDYLMTDDQGRATTYNMDGFRLRGVKQYWLRDKTVTSDPGANDKVATSFNTLEAGALFEGKIRFHNLTKAEVGLIIWSLKLKPESRQQIGKAKPLGYGRIKPEITGLSLLDLKKAYSSAQLSLSPFFSEIESKIEEYVTEYKKEIDEALHVLGIATGIEEVGSVKEFFAMRDSRHLAVPEKIRYMRITKDKYQKNEYQNRNPLPYVIDIKRS